MERRGGARSALTCYAPRASRLWRFHKKTPAHASGVRGGRVPSLHAWRRAAVGPLGWLVPDPPITAGTVASPDGEATRHQNHSSAWTPTSVADFLDLSVRPAGVEPEML